MFCDFFFKDFRESGHRKMDYPKVTRLNAVNATSP